MGRRMLAIQLSPVPTLPLEALIAADPIPQAVRQAAWRWAALFRWAVPERVRATLMHGWRCILAIEAPANEPAGDHDAVGEAGAPANPAPANGLGAEIPAAATPLMGSLLGVFGHKEA